MGTGAAPTPVKLSWEQNHHKRAAWTAHAIAELRSHLRSLDMAQDITQFAPNYAGLTDDRRVGVWGEIISAVAKFESSWNPCARSLEKSLGDDEVTGEPAYSEGLLQLSYGDVKNYPQLHLPFDWNADKALARDDCKKTILDPLKNISGGVAILADQVSRHREIVMESPYWSTLGEPDRWKDSKNDEIAAMVQQLPFVEADGA